MLNKSQTDRLGREALKLGLTPLLRSLADWHLDPADRSPHEPVPTLGEFLEDIFERHQSEIKSGWLDRDSISLIKAALVTAKIAVPVGPRQKPRSHPDFVWNFKRVPYRIEKENRC